MARGEDMHTAIERRDAAALRRMAEKSQTEETQILLKLLTDIIEKENQRLTQGVQMKKSA